jgi:hypothetical protein
MISSRYFSGIGLAIVGPFLSACVPAVGDYKFLEVISPQYSVDERGRSEIGKAAIGLYFDDEMPIRYSYSTTEYTIRINVALDSIRPQLLFQAEGLDGAPLLVGGVAVNDCFGVTHGEKFEHASLDEVWPILIFAMAKRNLPKCHERSEPIDEPMDIKLRIVNSNGERLGDEVVSVSLHENGKYAYWDGV